MIHTSLIIYINYPTGSKQLHSPSSTTNDVVLGDSLLVALRSSVTVTNIVGLANLIPMGQSVTFVIGLVGLLLFDMGVPGIGGHSWSWSNKIAVDETLVLNSRSPSCASQQTHIHSSVKNSRSPSCASLQTYRHRSAP
jgi:hypothetical protein